MKSGQILVAEQNGINVIKLLGDVRLVLCISFDRFIAGMFESSGFESVVFDLREASGIDSTTLGLMAKISIRSSQLGYPMPLVVTNSPSILRLLESMGFDDIFEIIRDNPLPEQIAQDLPSSNEEEALPTDVGDESQLKARIIEAHKILMSLNENNEQAFRELVETLERD